MIENDLNEYSNYFSLQNIDKLSEIDRHLELAESLIKKYSGQALEDDTVHDYDLSDGAAELRERDWSSLKEQVDFIRRKRNDKKLNLSVIGEFSTGKSTFINALLRKELLVSSALQGTTVASTIIDYSEQHCIKLQYLDGRPDEGMIFDDFDSLKLALQHFTTKPEIARQLRSVNVFLPAELLKDNFRIIDTPGTNVTDAWHEDVTIRTLKEVSDLSIVLISADKPASESMLTFVRSNLDPILPQCVFVVTKLDTVRTRERKGLLDYIKMKLERELEIREAVVLPYVSPAILSEKGEHIEGNRDITAAGDLSGTMTWPENITDGDLVNISMNFEQQLTEYMLDHKNLALTKKVTSLIDIMYQSISAQMERISEGYQSKLELLERTKQTDLNYFVQQEKQIRLKDFDDVTRNFLRDVDDNVRSETDKQQGIIFAKLNSQSDLYDLEKYIKESVGNDCSESAREITGKTKAYCKDIQSFFRKEMEEFEKSFKELYQTLNIIPLDMSKPEYKIPQKVQVEMSNLTSVVSPVSKKYGRKVLTILAFAFVGMFVLEWFFESALITILGGFIGGFIGKSLHPKDDVLRQGFMGKVRPEIVGYFNNVCHKSLSAVDKYTGQIRKCISDEIDEYLRRYQSEVDRQIEAENGQRAVMIDKINDLKNDMSLIQNRKIQLDSVTRQLHLLGRKEYEYEQ